jgi:hypothetical protein
LGEPIQDYLCLLLSDGSTFEGACWKSNANVTVVYHNGAEVFRLAQRFLPDGRTGKGIFSWLFKLLYVTSHWSVLENGADAGFVQVRYPAGSGNSEIRWTNEGVELPIRVMRASPWPWVGCFDSVIPANAPRDLARDTETKLFMLNMLFRIFFLSCDFSAS